MNLEYAVERLYQAGWDASGDELERLPDGRTYPTVQAIRREFARSGLDLKLQHNPRFNCYRATWSASKDNEADNGTVIGACEREAAVYALAQLLSSRSAVTV